MIIIVFLYKHYIKYSFIAVVVAYIIYLLYGLATTPYQAKTSELKTISSDDAGSLQRPSKPAKPSVIDIFPRLYTAEEVYERFKDHEFRATNDFKKCLLMVTGKVESISTVTFSKKPLVTLDIPSSGEGIKFTFENTDYDNDKIALLNAGDIVIISGWNAQPGTFGGVFLDNSQFMTDMVSKRKKQMLAVNGGVYDREICQK